jgi:hypothetical protein
VRFAVVGQAMRSVSRAPGRLRLFPVQIIVANILGDLRRHRIEECVVVRAFVPRSPVAITQGQPPPRGHGDDQSPLRFSDGAEGADAAEEPIGRSNMLKKGLAFPDEWSGTEGVLIGLWPERNPTPPV